MEKMGNKEVFFDSTSDPANPGWVLRFTRRWSEDDFQEEDIILNACDPDNREEAKAEAERFFGKHIEEA